MTQPHRKPHSERPWDWMRRNEDTAFAVIMAGVSALFIVGVVSAFNYASTDIVENRPAVTAQRAPAETTGAGGGNRPRPPQHDPREDEQLERAR